MVRSAMFLLDAPSLLYSTAVAFTDTATSSTESERRPSASRHGRRSKCSFGGWPRASSDRISSRTASFGWTAAASTGSSAAMGQRTLSQSAALSRLSHGDLASLAEKGADKEVSAEAVAQLPDFSHLLPEDYRKDYMSWRGGQAKGAKGEVELLSRRMQAMQDSLANNTSEEFTEVSVFRQGYAAWRRGNDTGAKSFASHWAV